MSKTDRTRPLRVKAMDRATDIEEFHDHRDGPCDLPTRPTKALTCLWGSDATTSCYWTVSHAFMVSPEAHCGCTAHSKKRDDYAIQESNRRRTANRREEHQARADVPVHGISDELADVADPWASDDSYDSNEVYDVAANAALRDRLAAAGLLPETTLVVDVRRATTYDCCEDCDGPRADGWRVDMLHNDGARETLRFDNNPWLPSSTPAVAVAAS